MADTATAAEYIDLPEPEGGSQDDFTMEDTEDGGMVVTMGAANEQPGKEGGGEFFENLADGVIPEQILDRIATDILRRCEQDEESRKPHDDKYAEGIKRTGMGDEAPGGAKFQGASKVVHPMLTEACIDFESRIIKELWPTAGPVKKKILGKPTVEKDERASRKVDYMNYQLTTVIKEARSTIENMLSQVPLGGRQYIQLWYDHRLQRPRFNFITVSDTLLPSNAADWYSATRRTWVETLSGVELKQRINQGIYREVDLPSAPTTPEKSAAGKANDKIEGNDPTTALNLDDDRKLYTTMSYLEVTDDMVEHLDHEKDGDIRPYLITMDMTTKKVLSLYRDWEPDDPATEPLDHLFEFPFLPWAGAYGIGLPHIAGGLSGAATGALRALLDSAHISNAQGAFLLKGSGSGGQNKSPQPNEIVEVDGGVETDDIRKKILPFATHEPSAVLFQLLGFVVEAGKGIVRTSLDENTGPDGNPNSPVPVGTQLARVEEGLTVFSAIHGRTHQAFNRLLMGLHRLNRMYLPEFVRIEDNGREIVCFRSDFDGPLDVQPVSDPTIYSDQQRFAQVAGLEQSAAAFPQLFNVREIQKEKLRLWKVADPERFLTPDQQPTELNAINENVAMALGRPVTVFPEQDHLAHLQAHLDFMQSPVLGMNPLISSVFLAPALKHCVQHVVLEYGRLNVDLIKEVTGQDAHELFSDDDRVKVMLDRLLAMTSQRVVPRMQQVFSGAMPVLQKVAQMVNQMQQQQQQAAMQQPADPAAMAAAQVAASEVQRKSAQDKQQGALTQAKQASDAALKQQQLQVDRDNALLAAQTKVATTQMDISSAQSISADRLEAGQAPRFSDGASLSPAP